MDFLTGLIGGLSPENLGNIMSQASQNQLVQYGFLFSLAAWIHSGRVKKEIKLNFASVTDAINSISRALREDLEKHGKRLDMIEGRVQNLEKR